MTPSDGIGIRLTSLDRFRFLCRPALREGVVSQVVFPISLESIVWDTETNEYCFPDQELVERVRSRLAALGGIPVTDIQKEQETRLTTGTLQPPHKPQPAAASEAGERQPAQLPSGTQPEPRSVRETQSRPALDEQQRALLAFLSEHPDMPVSSVYKGLGISVRKGNEIRESLTKQGFLLELELRSTRAGAGRPMKCMIPSFQAFAQLGIAPPKGRGSVIHRQLQQLVAEGASAKGYSAQTEKVLDNGTIVDVHLEKGAALQIAVEIAIASRPELELAHFRNCLAAGYDLVYAIFADEALLARTAQLVEEAYSEDIARKVRLLPVSKISQFER